MKPITVIGPYELDNTIFTDVQTVDGGAIIKQTFATPVSKRIPWVAVQISTTAGPGQVVHVGFAAWDYWRQLCSSLPQPHQQNARKAWLEYNRRYDLQGHEEQSEIDWSHEMAPPEA